MTTLLGTGEHRFRVIAQDSPADVRLQFVALYGDGQMPAPAPLLGLVEPFQDVLEQQCQSALDFAAVASGHVGEELLQVREVEIVAQPLKGIQNRELV